MAPYMVHLVVRHMPVLAFLAGLVVGAVLLGAAGLAPSVFATANSHVLPNDHIVALANNHRLSNHHRAAPAPVIATGKRALAAAPPRMVFSEITVPPTRAPAEAKPILLATGKRDLLADITTGSLRDTRPAIALMIDDLGIVPDRSAHALRLPAEVTLSFLPYGAVSRPLAQAASAKGHEIFLHVPMEPSGNADPGPGALLTRDSDTRLREKLDNQIADMGALVPIAGINNHMGSRATADRRVMDEVMRGAAERGFVFVDSVTTPRSTARASAAAHDVDFIARDIFLDHGQGPDFVLAQLAELEHQARTRGVAVAIAHPHTTTLDVLSVWVNGLERKGLRLVPMSEAITLENRKRMLAMVE